MSAGPTLTDAKGLGGVVAQGGFDYQNWNALIRLPNWLATPSFDGFLVEGTEDFEARFFSAVAPGGRVLDRFQAKTATLGLPEIKELFAGFKAFDDLHPDTVRSHTVVTPVLPSGLAWLARDPGRVKRSRSFYRPFATLIAAHDGKLLADFVATFGDSGAFYVEAVDIEPTPMPDRPTAEAMFSAALHAAFPSLDLGPRATASAFKSLLDRVGVDRGKVITRAEITALLRECGVAILDRVSLPVRLRGDDSEDDHTVVDVEGAAFSGAGGFPAAGVWEADLLAPLSKVAAFARDQRVSRIALSGCFRLTAALCLGWSFRAATGFEIDIPTREGVWRTNAHPSGRATDLPWQVGSLPALTNGRLVVAVGVLRDAVPGVVATFPDRPILRVFLDQAVASEVEAQESVREIKRAVDAAVTSLRPDGIDLFFVGPAALAAALGHRWNGLPPTQLFEFVPDIGRYVSTAILGS